MRFTALDDWLRWLEGLHPRAIDLGLDRVRKVAKAMDLHPGDATVITVGGTNGKGSSVAMLDAILRADGRRTGCYTSPHIHRFNERIRIDGCDADDAAIIEAFAAVDAARGDTTLSYFEFGTLAAMWLFRREQVDVWLLEVGLGGRLDAVNIVDADVALLTSIGIDHTDYLGDTREAIALEKVAIGRPGKPLVCGDPEPPQTLLDYVAGQRIELRLAGRDFAYRAEADRWHWRYGNTVLDDLPLPALAGGHQLDNAAAVLTALAVSPLPVTRTAVERGLSTVVLPGRFERIDAGFEAVLDVTHNPHGMARLAATLRAHPVPGRTLLLFGIMADKDVTAAVAQLRDLDAGWFAAAPAVERALPAERLAERLCDAGVDLIGSGSVADGVVLARQRLGPGDRLIVTGSFHTVAEARALLI